MRKATRDRFSGDFEFIDVELDDLYYKNRERAIVELEVEGSGLKRTCFVHRGHPTPTLPQNDFWTVSDVETGLALGDGASAQEAIDSATGKLQMPRALEKVVWSVTGFINEQGRANLVPNRPVIREGTEIFWIEGEKVKHGTVKSKRDHIASGGVACLVTHHPTAVVNVEDILYVWPEREDLCPST